MFTQTDNAMAGKIAEFERLMQVADCLLKDGKKKEAADYVNRAITVCPEVWLNIGTKLTKTQEWDKAMAHFLKVLAVCPDRKDLRTIATHNVGMVLYATGKHEESRKKFEESLALDPNFADAWVSLGLVKKWFGDTDGAISNFLKALKCNPHHALAEFSLALTYLLRGDFEQGWSWYESRWRTPDLGVAKIQCPRLEWDGRNPSPGELLCLYGEQGMGDTVQMLRFAPRLIDMGWTLCAACVDPLVPLLQSTGWFRDVRKLSDTIGEFDFHLPMMSLPRMLRAYRESDFRTGPYLRSSNPAWYGGGLHVGICWRGNPKHKSDRWRSTRLGDWGPILTIQGPTFHSLQVAEDLSELALFPRVKQHPPPKDAVETMDRLAGLDLLITCDTFVAHLAGAMGLPTWLMVPFAPDWRWQLGREDSPWYGSMRLFRQTSCYTWDDVIERIAKELKSLL